MVESTTTSALVRFHGVMGSRGIRLVSAAAAMTLFAVATAAGSGQAVKPVWTAAPVESEGGHLVAYGRSQLLVVQPSFTEDGGGVSRVNLDGTLDRSFGEDGRVQIASEDAAVTAGGKILVATTSHPRGGYGQKTKARVTRLLPDGLPDPAFGIDGHADVHFGRRYDYGEAVATAANGDILLAGIMVEYASNYGDEDRLAVARLKRDGSLDRSFGKRGIDLLPYWGEIGALDVTPTPSGGMLVEGGNELEATFLKLKRDGSIDRGFGHGGYREIRGRPVRNGHNEELMLVPGVDVLPSGKLLLAATGTNRAFVSHVVAVRLRPDGRVDRSYGRNGWVVAKGPGSAAGSTLLPGGDLAVATSFEGKAAQGLPFGAIAFAPDGHIDKRFGQDGRCRARLGRRHAAADVAIAGRHVVVGGEGGPGSWLLNCPLPSER
jgi:uncharacterized delta-60 repeat protein